LKMMPELRRDPWGLLFKLTQEYGPLVCFQFLAWPLYLITHPDHIKYILQENYLQYNKDVFDYQLLKHFLGNGLLTNEGDSWLRQRRLMQPAFHRQRIAAFGKLMTETTLAHMQRWKPFTQSNTPLDMAVEMMRLTLHIVCKALFSVDVTDEADTIGSAFSVVNRHLAQRSSSPLPLSLPVPGNLRFRSAVHALDKVVHEIIRQHREQKMETDDVLSMLLQTRDEETGEGMNDQQLHDEVITLLLAGHETTANALSWTWYLLSQHPEVEQQLHHELKEVLSGRLPTSEDLPRLPYTQMVIQESIRLYPPSWIISRNAVAEDAIGGYAIPAHAPILLLPYVTHRHPAFWQDPERFDPERFTPEQIATRPRYAYVPFGGGPRQCIGNTFAMTEAQLILATVAQQYRVALVPGQVISPEPLITLRPRNGLFMTLQRR
jgi:cytochrome P450